MMWLNMANAVRELSQEYTYFTFHTWQSNEVWSALLGNEVYAEAQAREFFWNEGRERIIGELKKLEDQGWETVEQIGPERIKLRRFQSVDYSIDPSDVFLWVLTLGIAFIIHLIVNEPRRDVKYKPIEFRVRMTRPKN